MSLIRTSLTVVLAAAVAGPLAAQIPTRRSGTTANTAPRLLVANPFVFTSADSSAAVQIGAGLRERMDKVVGRDFRIVTRSQMNEALGRYGYPNDAILGPAAARRFAQEFQARTMVSSTLARADAGRYTLTARFSGLNDDAGAVVSLTQEPNQKFEDLGSKVADQFSSAVKALEDARECINLRTARPDKAQQAAEKAIRTLPNHGLAELCLAQLAQDRKAPSEQVTSHLENAVKGDPLSLPAWTTLADQYQQRGDSSEVIRALKQMLLIAPTNQPLRENAFRVFLQYGRAETAKEVAEEGLEIDPTNADLFDLKSNACIFLGDYGCAVDALEQVFLNDSTKADTTFFLKITTVAGTAPDTARLLRWARIGANLYPDNKDLLSQLLTAYTLAGPLDSVVAVTRRFLEIDPTNSAAAIYAGQVLLNAKRFADAVPFLDEGARRGNTEDKENAALLLLNAARPLFQEPQDLVTAGTLLQKAVEIAPPGGRAAGFTNYFLGIALFAQVVKLDPQVESQKSCDLAREYEALLPRTVSAFELGRSTAEDDSAKRLQYLSSLRPRVASMVKAYCR